MLPEITEPTDLCQANGRLNKSAVGYSRRPLHRTNLRRWGRNKRWEYWGVVTESHAIGMTISNLDYLAVNQLYVLDRATGEEIVTDVNGVGFTGATLQDAPGPLVARIDGRKLTMEFSDHAGGTTLTARSDRVELEFEAALSGDCLAVVVPWDDWRFQYTVKDLARPVTGSITVDGQSFDIAPGTAFAALDRGRGRWPYSLTWKWAAAAGIVRRRRWAAVPAVMSVTLWLGAGVNGLIAAPIGNARTFPALSIPIALALPAAVASATVALGLLVGHGSGSWRDGRARTLAAVALLVFPALLTFIALTAPHMPNRARVPNGAVSWDVLDAVEIAALLALALALWRRAARTALIAGSAGLMLFIGDAFFNVVLTRGEAFDESLLFLFVGELPTSILCLLGIRSALRMLEHGERRVAPAGKTHVHPDPKGHIA